jgi:hypothetical protein
MFTGMPENLSDFDKLQRWKKLHDPGSVGILFRFPAQFLGLLMKSR